MCCKLIAAKKLVKLLQEVNDTTPLESDLHWDVVLLSLCKWLLFALLDKNSGGCRETAKSVTLSHKPYTLQPQVIQPHWTRTLVRSDLEVPIYVLLFADHLDRLRLRLSPQHFAQMWGKSHTNLQAILAEHTDEEKALARKHIDGGKIGLHLPLSANVEFDT